MATRRKGHGSDDLGFYIGPQPNIRRASKPFPGGRRKSKARPQVTPAAARRVAHRAPEAVVRVTGSARGFAHLAAHLSYIHRHGKLEGETSDGSLVIGKDDVKALAREWFARREAGAGGRQQNAKDTVNIVLSMPAGTPRPAVTDAARLAAQRIFGERNDYVMVTHTDTPSPHVHLTVMARGRDGSRLNPNPGDLQGWRERFAEALREQGVEAEATPRDLRGVVRKSPSQAIWHIERRGAESTVRVQELREAISTVTGQLAAGERPWELATQKRQARVRTSWLTYADALERVGDSQSLLDAIAVRAFVAEMPEPVTRRELVERSVRRTLAERQPGERASPGDDAREKSE